MKGIKLTSTILLSKIIIKGLRMIKRGGTSLPGKIANKLCPGILKDIASNFYIIMVTGTNGKTTTSRIIEQILKETGTSYIANRSGANLLSGITTTFLQSVNLHGRSSVSTALIEIDEAAFKAVTVFLEPDILVVTNFFRDQLDRYGELYSTLKDVAAGISKTRKTRLILNADDSLCVSLARDSQKSVIYYGFAPEAYLDAKASENADASYCLYCQTKYTYTNKVYGHLGGFACPGCGYRKPDCHVVCTQVEAITGSHSVIRFTVDDGLLPSCDGRNAYTAKINLPGLYNIYNSLAAISCGVSLGISMDKILYALASFENGFGRMETIKARDRELKVILVKNPAGFNQVLDYLVTDEQTMRLAFAINDNLADGTDVSWLWDVNFEKLSAAAERIDGLFVSGIRAEDMALRLKYAGLDTKKIELIKDYGALIEKGLSSMKEGETFYLLPTYTALLDMRKFLKKKFNLKEFWQ
jgi:UDP-N-acetylmuramyl tripeptide synthase